MSHIDLAKRFKKYASSDAFFYVTLDPERALGLEDVLPNYTIICPYKSRLTEKLKRLSSAYDRVQGVRVVVLGEHMPESEVDKIVRRGTYGILKSDFVKEHIQDAHDREHLVYVLSLKNSQLIETFCKKMGWELLAPKAKVAEQFENKISQYKALKNIVPYPETFLSTIEGLYRREIGRQLVLQFNRGHSGNSTFFIKTKKELETLYKLYPKRECKISEYIRGKTYTLNCLALQGGEVITGSISEQITGLKTATYNPNTTCGNDFISPRKLRRIEVNETKKIAQTVGKALHQKEYRGLFGIDVIIEESSRKVYFIEVNTHQPASISFEAKLHRKIGKVPLLAYFILDSLAEGGGWNLGILSRNRDMPPLILPISAKQIIYRNKTSKTLTQKYVEKEYKGRGVMTRMKYIKSNEEIYRIQYGV